MFEPDSAAGQIQREIQDAGRNLASLAHAADYAGIPQVAGMLWSIVGILDEYRPGAARPCREAVPCGDD